MALVDMPLEQLWNYRGTNPRPADFDQFWDKSHDEILSVDPAVELKKADFQAPGIECLDMFYTSAKGARIHAKLCKPKNASDKMPAVLKFHGYTGSAGDWAELLGYAGCGFIIAAMDCRGQGGLSQDVNPVDGYTYQGQIIRGLQNPPDNLLFRDIYLDTAMLARIVLDMPETDSSRLGAFGGSQGGGLTLACAALEPRVSRIASVFPFLCDYQRVWSLDLETQPYDELKQYFRRFDPLHQKETEVFTKLGYIDCYHLSEKIKAKTLMFVGLRDTICPPSSIFAAYNNIKADKKLEIFPDFGHENLPTAADMTFQHFLQWG